MALNLARPSPQEAHQQWAVHCATHAQALRTSAERASTLQAERAVTEYGAAAAMDRAATLWSEGAREDAQAWMNAAGAQLAAALIPVPWQ
jgi:predicted negative regulator of RcsB-dependent stress response